MIDAIKSLGRGALEILHARFELLVLEIAQEQSRVGELVMYAGATLLCVFLTLVTLVVFAVALAWDTPYRMLAIGAITVCFALCTAAFGAVCVRKAKVKPKLFGGSLHEIGIDLDRLK
jgi:uncharacterized membrane protein YqjE